MASANKVPRYVTDAEFKTACTRIYSGARI